MVFVCIISLYIGTATCGDDTVPQFKNDHPVWVDLDPYPNEILFCDLYTSSTSSRAQVSSARWGLVLVNAAGRVKERCILFRRLGSFQMNQMSALSAFSRFSNWQDNSIRGLGEAGLVLVGGSTFVHRSCGTNLDGHDGHLKENHNGKSLYLNRTSCKFALKVCWILKLLI